MAIRDVYLLKRSNGFYLNPRQEVIVDLALKKAPIRPCTNLSGRVFGHCGPLPGATVKVFFMDYTPVSHVITDENGRFSFRDVLNPGRYRVLATADGYNVSEDKIISLEPNKLISIEIKLKTSSLDGLATVYGVVRDILGFAVDNVNICILNECHPDKTIATTHTNEDGEYIVYGLASGKYQITVQKTGYICQQPSFFDCYPNEIVPLDLFMYEDERLRNGTISGKIEYRGRPVPHAAVALYRVEDERHVLVGLNETNDEGIYLFVDVQTGNYLVKAKLMRQTGKENDVCPSCRSIFEDF